MLIDELASTEADELSPAEQLLKDFIGFKVVDLRSQRLRAVRASKLRSFLMDRSRSSDSQPFTIQIAYAEVSGFLDLDATDLNLSLQFYECRFEDVSFRNSSLRYLEFKKCVVRRLWASGLHCRASLGVLECEIQRGLVLNDATVDGALSLNKTKIRSGDDVRAALTAYRVKVAGDVIMNEVIILNSFESGRYACNFNGCSIGGGIGMHGAEMYSAGTAALTLTKANVAQGLFITEKSRISGKRQAAILAADAQLGEVSISGSTISCGDGPVIVAPRLRCESQFLIARSRLSSASGTGAAISMAGCTARAQYSLSGVTVLSAKGCLVELDGAQASGFALSGVYRTASKSFAISMVDAKCDNSLTIATMNVDNLAGPALSLDRISVGGALIMESAVRFSGLIEGYGALVSIGAARIKDEMRLQFRLLDNRSLDRSRWLSVLLEDTRIDNDLHFDYLYFRTHKSCEVRLDGLTFQNGPWKCSFDEWLTLISSRTDEYFAQPYQNIAGVAKRSGHEEEWRRALILQQKDLRRRGNIGSWGPYVINLASGLLVGHGYKPWRALAGLLACFLIALFAIAGLGSDSFRRPAGVEPSDCSAIEKIRLAAGYSVPFVALNASRNCELRGDSGKSPISGAILLGTQLSGWAASGLFVAGFTGVVRRRP